MQMSTRHDQIQRAAYYVYLHTGCTDAEKNWHEAEAQVRRAEEAQERRREERRREAQQRRGEDAQQRRLRQEARLRKGEKLPGWRLHQRPDENWEWRRIF